MRLLSRVLLGLGWTSCSPGTAPPCAGSPHATIQSAIDAARPGDVITVCPGTWQERLTLSGKALTLRSRDGAGTTIVDGRGRGRTVRVERGAVAIVEGFTFVNGSSNEGGNLSCEDAHLELRGSVLRSGTAGNGGGLSAVRCGGVAEGNTFEDNVAYHRGGGAYLVGDGFALRDDEVRSNGAGEGGGVYLEGDAPLSDNTLEGNHANLGGGAFVEGGHGEIDDNRVVGNTSVDDGGGIYVSNGGPGVARNHFEGNDAGGEGGGLRVKLATATIGDNTFVDNHADLRGGAMRVSHEAVTMEGNTYTTNDTWGTGGAVLLYESASILRNETYTGNTATTGGALAILEGWGDVLIEDCTFDGNHASAEGGQIHVHLVGHVTTVRRSTFEGGTADRGAGIFADQSGVQVENSVFAHQAALSAGGAAWLSGASGHFVNNVLVANRAPIGAAIGVEDGAGLEVVNSVFHANTDGAAVAIVAGAPPSFRYDTFSAHTSDFSGMESAVGTHGNLASSPGFVDEAGGDFQLSPASGLIDLGDPDLADPDGSRSDIGRFGGPEAL